MPNVCELCGLPIVTPYDLWFVVAGGNGGRLAMTQAHTFDSPDHRQTWLSKLVALPFDVAPQPVPDGSLDATDVNVSIFTTAHDATSDTGTVISVIVNGAAPQVVASVPGDLVDMQTLPSAAALSNWKPPQLPIVPPKPAPNAANP